MGYLAGRPSNCCSMAEADKRKEAEGRARQRGPEGEQGGQEGQEQVQYGITARQCKNG